MLGGEKNDDAEITGGAGEGDAQGAGLQYGQETVQWALLRFQQPVHCPLGSLIIGSRLDTVEGNNKDKDAGVGVCRLAFYGPILKALDIPSGDKDQEREALAKEVKLYTPKSKRAEVSKVR